MVNTITGKVSNYFQRLAQLYDLNLKRVFYTIILIPSPFPLAYVLFLNVKRRKLGLSITGVMKLRPTIRILSTLRGLDVMTGYSLWMIREQVLALVRLYHLILTTVLITQLFVSNHVASGARVAGLMFSGHFHYTERIHANCKVIVPMSLLTFGYVFTMAMMVAVMTR